MFRRKWLLVGWDAYAGESYTIRGRYWTSRGARWAAWWRIFELERRQPSETSGGQKGIQDRVTIVGPAGVHWQYDGPSAHALASRLQQARLAVFTHLTRSRAQLIAGILLLPMASSIIFGFPREKGNPANALLITLSLMAAVLFTLYGTVLLPRMNRGQNRFPTKANPGAPKPRATPGSDDTNAPPS